MSKAIFLCFLLNFVVHTCDGLATNSNFRKKLFESRRTFFTDAATSILIGYTINIPNEAEAYSVSGISSEGLNVLQSQEEGTRAYIEKQGYIGDAKVANVIEPGTKSYDYATKIMKKFNKSMEECKFILCISF